MATIEITTTTTTKNEKAYTNATALAAAIELSKAAQNDALTEKLVKMHEAATKPRAKSTTPTKTQLENLGMMAAMVRVMDESANDTFTNLWVQEHVRGIFSSQKATAILTLAVKNGYVDKGEKVKGKMTYYRTDQPLTD